MKILPRVNKIHYLGSLMWTYIMVVGVHVHKSRLSVIQSDKNGIFVVLLNGFRVADHVCSI